MSQLGRGQPGRCHCPLPDGLERRQLFQREASTCLLLMLSSTLFNLLQQKVAQFPLPATSKLCLWNRAAAPGSPFSRLQWKRRLLAPVNPLKYKKMKGKRCWFWGEGHCHPREMPVCPVCINETLSFQLGLEGCSLKIRLPWKLKVFSLLGLCWAEAGEVQEGKNSLCR